MTQLSQALLRRWQPWRVFQRAVVSALVFVATPFLTSAASGSKISFDIPSITAAQALKKFSTQSGQQLLYSNNDIAGVTTNEVKGDFTTDDALTRLLAGTALIATRDPANGAVAIGRGTTSP